MNSTTIENSETFPPPSLSPSLLIDFNSLSGCDKDRFILMYRYLWGCVLPAGSFAGASGVLRSYWVAEYVRYHSGVTVWDLSILSYMYYATKKGKKYIHSKNIYNRADLFHTSPRWLADRLTLLKRSGYVVRSCSDPGRKYNPGLKQKQFVNLSSKGVQLIKDMERDIYRILVDGCLTDLTGTKKKPRRISRA